MAQTTSSPPTSVANAAEMLVDQEAIFRLIRAERFARDSGDWDAVAGAYVEDSYVRTTWFEGTGEDFAKESRAMAENGRHSKHPIWPIYAKVNGAKALAESYSQIQNRSVIDGVSVDMVQYCRFFSRLLRTTSGWRLASFEAIYQWDTISPTNPADVVPIDWSETNGLRESYRIWAWAMQKRGYVVSLDLLGDDRPDLVRDFYREADEWLAAPEQSTTSTARSARRSGPPL